jgi:hypothetical protein
LYHLRTGIFCDNIPYCICDVHHYSGKFTVMHITLCSSKKCPDPASVLILWYFLPSISSTDSSPRRASLETDTIPGL